MRGTRACMQARQMRGTRVRWGWRTLRAWGVHDRTTTLPPVERGGGEGWCAIRKRQATKKGRAARCSVRPGPVVLLLSGEECVKQSAFLVQILHFAFGQLRVILAHRFAALLHLLGCCQIARNACCACCANVADQIIHDGRGPGRILGARRSWSCSPSGFRFPSPCQCRCCPWRGSGSRATRRSHHQRVATRAQPCRLANMTGSRQA
jgi:hypothetical protein